MADDELMPADAFWQELESAGVTVTDRYTADGKSRFCEKRDGQKFVVSVHRHYPQYTVDKVLAENGFFGVPLYDSAN